MKKHTKLGLLLVGAIALLILLICFFQCRRSTPPEDPFSTSSNAHPSVELSSEVGSVTKTENSTNNLSSSTSLSQTDEDENKLTQEDSSANSTTELSTSDITKKPSEEASSEASTQKQSDDSKPNTKPTVSPDKPDTKPTVAPNKPDTKPTVEPNKPVVTPSLDKIPTLKAYPSLTTPTFSVGSGMYTAAFSLTLKALSGETIFYTTDGSDPATSATAKKYTGSISIIDRSNEPNLYSAKNPSDFVATHDRLQAPTTKVDKCTVIRAIAVKADGSYSLPASQSYFVNKNNATYHNVAVLSVTTDPKNLYDPATGIYVKGNVFDAWRKKNPWAELNGSSPANYNQRGRTWEREAYAEFFDSNGTLGFSQAIGLRIQGGWSRNDAQKSFRLVARESYGTKNFKYEVFSGLKLKNGSGEVAKKFRTLVVRNGGNDSTWTKFKDAAIQSLVTGTGLKFETQASRPCVLFLNGEYWGLYTIQEDYSEHYFSNHYGVDNNEVVVFKNWKIDEGLETEDVNDSDLFWGMHWRITQQLDAANENDYKKIEQLLDIDSFIDYVAVQTYIGNQDWPGGNFAFWRTRNIDSTNPYADGKWRMCLFDTEFSTSMYDDNQGTYNTLKNLLDGDSCIGTIFKALLKNPSFKQKYIDRMYSLSTKEFSPSNAKARINAYANLYRPNMQKYYERFPGWYSINTFEETKDRMINFLNKRPAFLPNYLKQLDRY